VPAALLSTAANAQVGVGIGVGPGYGDYGYGYPAPVCSWGYYNYYPYSCAPYGYYGPSWFFGGVFFGAGPGDRGRGGRSGWWVSRREKQLWRWRRVPRRQRGRRRWVPGRRRWIRRRPRWRWWW